MLEYALKQERAKLHKLKYGTELNQDDMKPPVFDENRDETVDGETVLNNCNVTWRQGRQLLRQYLQEIGYTDTVIDVRSARVRSLLGLTSNKAENEEARNNAVNVNGEQPAKRASETQGRRIPAKKMPTSIAEATLMDSEASVMATFNFLTSESEDMEEDDEENLSDEMEDGSADEEIDERLEARRMKPKVKGDHIDSALADAETEEVLSEFDFLGPDSGEGAGEARSQGDGSDWDKRRDDSFCTDCDGDSPASILELKEQFQKDQKNKKGCLQRPKRSALQAMLANLDQEEAYSTSNANPARDFVPFPGSVLQKNSGSLYSCMLSWKSKDRSVGMNEDGNIDSALGLDELATITVNNDSDERYDVASNKEPFRKTWTAKYTLRSHFDGVRALAFHPTEPVLITASEDHTLKLWNLQKTVPAKKTASLDVEPVYTFRGHQGPVLCLAMSASGEQCFSGGLDSTICCWNIPNSLIDPYDSFDPGALATTLTAHTDAVWGLSIHSNRTHLLSCSADGTVRLWAPQSKNQLLNTYCMDSSDGIPTSVDFVRCDSTQMVSSFNSSNTVIYDLESGKPVIRFDSNQIDSTSFNKQINRVVSHPTMPLTITAHEDRHMRFYDNNSGKLVHSMVAHLDAVTCLAVDPNGLFLLSGSHDCSIRLWNLDNKTCVQEITSHRKKFDESIFDVAFHPSKAFIASAGADALAKVFV
ncbi:Striatin-3, variant 2 [Chamberlinius hualienensis]